MVTVQVFLVHMNEIYDLMSSERVLLKKTGSTFEVQATKRTVHRASDLAPILRAAQGSRSTVAKSLSLKVGDLKRRSHLVIRLSAGGRSVVDLVQLCGSEQAISQGNSLQSKQQELHRKFVVGSFNSLSALIISLGEGKKVQETSLISDILSKSMGYSSQVTVTCTLPSGKAAFKHSLAALKFVSKIREAVKRTQDRNYRALQELEGMIQEQTLRGTDSSVLDKLLKLKTEYFNASQSTDSHNTSVLEKALGRMVPKPSALQQSSLTFNQSCEKENACSLNVSRSTVVNAVSPKAQTTKQALES